MRSGHTISCGCNVIDIGRKNKKDLTGRRFGNLIVIRDIGRSSNGRVLWECKCDCGEKTAVISSDLLNGSTQSCGCLQKERAAEVHKIDLSNYHIGNFTIIKEVPNIRYVDGSIIWDCKCDFCGGHKNIPSSIILHSIPYSCGCISLGSKGEQKIKDIFRNNQINFISQYTFKDCINPKTNRKLPFDFYLPDYNCCIEYDGIQHFKCIRASWDTQEDFQERTFRDTIKNKYCKEHNIALIRIPYWDFDKITFDYLKEKIYTLI